MAIRIPKKVDVITGIFSIFAVCTGLMAFLVIIIFFTDPNTHIDLPRVGIVVGIAVLFGALTVWSYKDDTSDN